MPNARVHTFEPVPASYRVLTERLDGRARLYNLAIGAQDGTMPISGGEYLPMASLSRKDAPVIATVDVRRLDTVCAEQGIDRIDVLKIDTEGHELAVLQGAGNLLTERRIGLIQFETGGTQIHARTYADDFFALLEPAGYRIYRLLRDGLTPLKHDGHYEIFAYANLVAVPLS
jgi:FkbM family methyltransferase